MSLIEELRHAETFIPADVTRTWKELNAAKVVLQFPAQDADGFDVEIHASPNCLVVYADAAHSEVEDPPELQERVREALRWVQDLLSPRTRLRIQFAGSAPYRWSVEVFEDGKWKVVFLTGLLFWNFFGRRHEVIRQNRIVNHKVG